MAPKRGGGGISSSGFDGDDDSESSPWTHMTQLYGSNFRNHYLMAQIVIIGICLFALVIIAIWALSFKKQNPPSRALFRWYSFGTAITIALVSYGYVFAEIIIRANGTVVAVVFFLISAIFLSLIKLAEITILFTIYIVLIHCPRPRNSLRWTTLNNFLWPHAIFCGILFILFVAILSLRIAVVVISVEDGYSPYMNVTSRLLSVPSLVSAMVKLNVAFNVLYMCMSLEILVLASLNLAACYKQRFSKLDALVLLAAISFPLFLRSVIEAAFSIVYGLQSKYGTQSGYVAETFFYYFSTTAVYAGVVFIGARLAKHLPTAEAAVIETGIADNGQATWNSTMTGIQQQQWQDYSKHRGPVAAAVPIGITGAPHGSHTGH